MNKLASINHNPDYTTGQDWKTLQLSFADLYKIKNNDHREYELHHAAQRFQIPTDVYRKLFQSYSQTELLTNGKAAFRLFGQSPKKALEKGLEILSRLGWLSMLGIMAALSLQLVELWEREEYLSWAIVSLNQGKATNGGRSLALETLALIDSNLAGLNIENAVLPGLNLSGSQLLQANFSNANLMQANLSNTELIYANLEGTYLEHANLAGANLELANLRGAQLQHANLAGVDLDRTNLERANLIGANLKNVENLDQAILGGALYDVQTKFPHAFDPVATGAIFLKPGANLSNANLSGAVLTELDLKGASLVNTNLSGALLIDINLADANLAGANFENVVGLTPTQIKAAQNWDKAIFDEPFRQRLGL